MGFTSNTIKLLLHAKNLQVNFERPITLGRQQIFLSSDELIKWKQHFNVAEFPQEGRKSFSEPILHRLGAKSIESLDVSTYENATIIHDLNLPIPDNLKSKFTTLIDGGTLEHIFNFPVAIKNCMEMIEVNGYYVGITPSNNQMGHGFFQFSPELFFRIFNETNGFEMIKMYFFNDEGSKFYEVTDPLSIGQRTLMINAHKSSLFVLARKIENKEIFSQPVLQSDYEHVSWKKKPLAGNSKNKGVVSKWWLPNIFNGNLKRFKYSNPIGSANPAHFKEVNLD